MNKVPLVIFTYCQHYHLTKLAILHARKHLEFSEIIVMYDDVVAPIWQVLGHRLQQDMLNEHDIYVTICPFSSIKATLSIKNGWIRQQIVKLNLYQLFDHEGWIFLDGDAILLSDLEPREACYINAGDIPSIPSFNFYNYLLDLDNQRVLYNGRPIAFSAVPFRYIAHSTLRDLADHVLRLHGIGILEVYDSFKLKNRDRYFVLSEFDIIGSYENIISQNSLPIKPIGINFAYRDEFIDLYEKNDLELLVYATDFGTDKLPRTWYEQKGVKINENIWKMLKRED